MGLEKRKKVIDGFEFEVTTLDAYSATPVWHKIAKVVIPALDELARGGAVIEQLVAGEVENTALAARLALRAVSLAVQKLDASDLRYCIDAFAKATAVQVNDKQQPQLDRIFAAHFAGKQTAMWAWFYFCCEVNFRDFLDVAQGMMKRAKPAQSEPVEGRASAEGTSPSESPAE